ncbi:MAG: hypothetical protein DRG30_03835 [Epsilonproteobacteria bacterium]|nr:MAG: hypothetical protein DRG30_03835 [Campylobacterota bacterium]
MQTALIPYMDRYILDGHYKIIDHKLGREATKELNRLPSLGVEVNYQQEKSINLYFLTINITVSCDATRFEEMESIILHNIPDDFTQKMVDMFQHIPSEKISLASSFIRTMDFLDTVHGYTEKETRLLSGLPTSNYELNGGGSVIPYDILKIYYDQKSLDKSISEGVYQNVKNAKALVKNGEENRLYASVFYSMIGTFAINDQDIDEFRFLEDLRSERARKVFTYEIEKLFNNLEEDIDFEMYPVFLDFTLSLHDIMDEIDEFRDFMGGLFVKKNLKKMHEYSVYKDSKPNIFTKFISKK